MDCENPLEMSSTVSLAWSVFLGGVLGGWYLYELYAKQKSLEHVVFDASGHVDQLEALQQAQTEILSEYDQRIREKKDYDEDEEVDGSVYQAWKGHSIIPRPFSVEITIWREKLSTFKKNREWKDWQGVSDGSCVVRDYYIGNLNPDFSWSMNEAEGVLCGSVRETMVNGWDSVVKMKIDVLCDSTEVSDRSNDTWNHILKEALEKNLVWSKELISVPQVL